MVPVSLHFEGDLRRFVRAGILPRTDEPGVVRRAVAKRSSVKDVIESCGVPHTEVDLIVERSSTGTLESRSFDALVLRKTDLLVYPAPLGEEIFPNRPPLQRRGCDRFVADVHLGKLARNLRLLGFDTAYERDADDARLIEIMQREDRALLTRDRPLLMRSVVRDGYCPRSDDADEQTKEVVRRFALHGRERPFTRCLACNGTLGSIEKRDVLDELADEPLTLRFYQEFFRCGDCRKLYWPGTHYEKLQSRLGQWAGR
jgi:uncharacterized protein